MSGFVSPARTATPRPERPISARGPITAPFFISASIIGGFPITTSKRSPASIFFLTSTLTPKRRSIVFPVAFSNCAQSSRTAAFGPLPLRTLISAACEGDAAANDTTAKAHSTFIQVTNFFHRLSLAGLF
jgi:hypothetical protein